MRWILAYFTIFGFSLTFWTAIGIVRFVVENFRYGILSFLKKSALAFEKSDINNFLVASLSSKNKKEREKEWLETRYDTLVTFGVTSAQKILHLRNHFVHQFQNARVINIDTNIHNQKYGEINVVTPQFPIAYRIWQMFRENEETGISSKLFFSSDIDEMKSRVESLIKEKQKKVYNRDEVTLILSGIIKYSNYFHPEKSSEKMRILAKTLLSNGANIEEIVRSEFQGLQALKKEEELKKLFQKDSNFSIKSVEEISKKDKFIPRILEILKNSNSVVLFVDALNNWDALSSVCATYLFLKSMGKTVHVILPSNIEKLQSIHYRILFNNTTKPQNSTILLDSKFTSFYNEKFLLNPYDGILPHEVASITAAHNEEANIEKTLFSLQKILPSNNIFVASDGSTDRTAEIVRRLGSNVLEISPNRGKASSIQYALEYFQLYDRFKAVIIIDADSEVSREYLTYALPKFNDPEVSAVAVHAEAFWTNHWPPRRDMFFRAYRVRFYKILQAFLRYGQTWKLLNVSTIVPGFASIYRTSALRSIDIAAPGLVIEDYNMTFELHHKKLGKIAYTNKAFGVTDDPHTLRDYIKQVKRWNLGFWQTVRRHGFWASPFSFFLFFYILELVGLGILYMSVPFFLSWFLFYNFQPIEIPLFQNLPFLARLSFWDVIFGVFIADYCLTVVVAYLEKKPILLLYGIGFTFLRYLDTFFILYTLPLAFLIHSTGKWVSPKRVLSEQ